MAVTHIDTIIHILNELTAFIIIYHYSQRNTSDRDNETRNDRKYRQEQMEREQREREQMERERMERMEELEKSEKLRKSRWGAQMKAELFRVNKLNMAEKKRRENAEKRKEKNKKEIVKSTLNDFRFELRRNKWLKFFKSKTSSWKRLDSLQK